jgi:siroheme synthase
VRLKGGDPFVFGRGSEECRALAAAGIPFEVVPGVSSANGALAYAGIPVTHRGLSSAFTVVTGHRRSAADPDLDWSWLSGSETLVVLMGLGRLAEIASRLVEHGKAPDTPVAVVSCGSAAEQRVVRGTLADIAARGAGLRSPATIVIGGVAALGDGLGWFDPASGARVFAAEEGEETDAPIERRSQTGG